MENLTPTGDYKTSSLIMPTPGSACIPRSMPSLGRSIWRGSRVGQSKTLRQSGDGTNLRGVREEEPWEEQGGVKTLSLSVCGAVHGWGTT